MEALHKFRNVLDKIVGTICVLLFALMVVVGTYQICMDGNVCKCICIWKT